MQDSFLTQRQGQDPLYLLYLLAEAHMYIFLNTDEVTLSLVNIMETIRISSVIIVGYP